MPWAEVVGASIPRAICSLVLKECVDAPFAVIAVDHPHGAFAVFFADNNHAHGLVAIGNPATLFVGWATNPGAVIRRFGFGGWGR